MPPVNLHIAPGPARVRLGHIQIDQVTMAGALQAIEQLVAAGRGGLVFTPNVDHVIIAERNPEFREAYAGASLSLADGMPILWAAHLLGQPLPEKVSGSDLVLPLCERAAARGWRVYLLGAGSGIAEAAARQLRQQLGLEVVGTDAPRIRIDGEPDDTVAALERVRAARPDLLLLAFGAPKQEVWAYRHRQALGGAVAIGVGASLDFIAGTVRRAPRWMSRVGLEWLYRLLSEPRRLWRRYLVDDPWFAVVVWRTWRARRAGQRQP